MCKLFIIGNGFDLASGLKTSYKDFHKYMFSTYKPTDEFSDKMPKSERPGIITSYDEEEMGKFWYHLINNSCKKENWSDFEESLSTLDFTYALENWENSQIENYYAKNAATPPINEWDKTRNLKEFRRNFNNIICYLNDCFSGWIKSIDITKGHKIDKFNNIMDLKVSKFLNFNYTMTLENLYNIPYENVCHIHVFNENFIFGHGVSENKIIKYYNDYKNINIARTFQQITEFLRKNTNSCLEQNETFFAALNNITDIYSYGFSFSKVDLPYIERICAVANKSNVTWHQYSYNDSNYTDILRDCGFEGEIRFW